MPSFCRAALRQRPAGKTSSSDKFKSGFNSFSNVFFSTLLCLPHDSDQWKYIRHVGLLEELGS